MAEVRVNSDTQNPEPNAEAKPDREPYERPSIEKFPPLNNVTFGTNLNPTVAGAVF